MYYNIWDMNEWMRCEMTDGWRWRWWGMLRLCLQSVFNLPKLFQFTSGVNGLHGIVAVWPPSFLVCLNCLPCYEDGGILWLSRYARRRWSTELNLLWVTECKCPQLTAELDGDKFNNTFSGGLVDKWQCVLEVSCWLTTFSWIRIYSTFEISSQ